MKKPRSHRINNVLRIGSSAGICNIIKRTRVSVLIDGNSKAGVKVAEETPKIIPMMVNPIMPTIKTFA